VLFYTLAPKTKKHDSEFALIFYLVPFKIGILILSMRKDRKLVWNGDNLVCFRDELSVGIRIRVGQREYVILDKSTDVSPDKLNANKLRANQYVVRDIDGIVSVLNLDGTYNKFEILPTSACCLNGLYPSSNIAISNSEYKVRTYDRKTNFYQKHDTVSLERKAKIKLVIEKHLRKLLLRKHRTLKEDAKAQLRLKRELDEYNDRQRTALENARQHERELEIRRKESIQKYMVDEKNRKTFAKSLRKNHEVHFIDGTSA